MIQNMTTMKADITYLIKEKEKTEESYQAASKCIADQQGIITTQSETIKILKNRLTLELENSSAPAGLRHRKFSSPVPSPAPAPPAPAAPYPGEEPEEEG